MVDTARTRAEILALLADNTAGDISPQDIRDAIVSMFGVSSAIYVADGSVAQTGITTTPAKMTGFTNNLAGVGGMTPDHTDDSIEVPIDGDYLFLAQISASGSINDVFEVHVAIDDVNTPFGTHRKLSTGGDEGSKSILAPLYGMTAGEKVTLQINITPSGTGEFTPIDMQLFGLKIS